MRPDEDDPHAVLERLHEVWATATEETEVAFDILVANPLDQALREDCYAKLQVSNQTCQSIMKHKRKSGI